MATPTGKSSRAWVAGPLSPEKPAWPVPATVVMVPGAGCSAARLIRAGESAVTPTAMEPYKKTRRFIENLLVSQVISLFGSEDLPRPHGLEDHLRMSIWADRHTIVT